MITIQNTGKCFSFRKETVTITISIHVSKLFNLFWGSFIVVNTKLNHLKQQISNK